MPAASPKKIGKYEVLDLIGRGGMGVVYRARDPLLDRVVAIKVITIGFDGDPELLQRFYREARATANLNHPNIVTVYELGDHEGSPYLVMEYLEGSSLHQILKSGRALTLIQKLAIIIQVCHGLSYAHQRNIVHRDIKPGNIVVLKDDAVKIVDFGIARIGDTGDTRTGNILGSIQYMSPEQINGKSDIDGRADIYCTGVELYQVLTGALPFEADSTVTTLLTILHEPPPPFSKYLTSFPPELETITLKALSKDRDQRYSSADKLAADLSQLLDRLKQERITDNLRQAKHLLEESNLSQAHAKLREVLELDKQHSEAAAMLRTVRQQIENQDAERVRQLRSNAEEALRVGSLDLARRVAEQAVQEYPSSPALEQLLARVQAAQTEMARKQPQAMSPPGGNDTRPDPAAGEFTRFFPPVAPELKPAPQPPQPPSEGEQRPPEATRLFSLPSADEEPEDKTRIIPEVPSVVLRSDAAPRQESLESATGAYTRVFVDPSAGQRATELFPKVSLIFTASGDPLLVGRAVTLSSMPFRIGRANSHLSIATDRGLSREHAVIEWQPSGFTIMDLNSSNGTYLNGKRLHSGSPEPLPFGAIIRIGDSLVLTFSSDEIIELPDLTGSVIAGRYRLSRIIRNGFKSALYQATDTRLPQDVAVKLLSPSLVRFSGYVEQFDREANMAVRLSHPNIVKVIDYGETQIALAGGKLGTTKYLTMELMQGTSLAERLASKTLPTLEQILSWIDDVSNALEYAHAEGVIHSGLKLSSVLLDRQGRAYVTDFGMAYGQADNGKRIFFGSPEFLAPEQWDGSEAVSAKVDQYSLGVLTYLLLAGSYPFEGQRDPNVRDRNFITGPPAVHEEALRKSHRVLHGAVSLALSRALSVRPDERFPSVREFFSALKGAITNPSITGKLRIFVSYQRDPSSGWAAFFARELEEKHGISVYVDTQQVEGVGRFPVRLANAVKACDVFVCLLASTTLQSKWVQNEIKLAWESGRPMIPVFQESFTLPDGSDTLEPYIEALLNYDGVHLLDHRHIHVDHTIAEVARIVKQSRPQGTRPASH